ncbi:homoserine O-acetyltransferase [Mangrovibacillus cuniculi]|uniref:Homoserine O-acetyltransferase n=1 Tax=Mangrovibacillus cuniculi TaxID=2593652 RepID=A0A7S8HG08_9BACI|nr:homoserine O-acetyltransferase [Mangrovibacillus cuniculi]QPC47479.1 homoserine O-acetyltransferase [Mangrovibacillus cuniculi]
MPLRYRETGKVHIGSYTTERGEVIPAVEVAYERVGNPHNPVVLVCHALTGNQVAVGTEDQPGWWAECIGTGKYVDTNEFQVLTFNVLGSCYGSTGPTSTSPSGKPYGATFPEVTIRDMVHVQRKALDKLNISSIHAVIGGSLGGMQVLEWLVLYPSLINRAVVLASTAALSPYAIAFNHVGEQAILLDPNFQDGNYPSNEGLSGLSIARMVGMITYRSKTLFQQRYGEVRSGIQSYLDYQGEIFLQRFDANAYLRLLRAMNQHDIGRDRGGVEKVLREIQTPVTLIGYEGDLLYSIEEMEEMANVLPNSTFVKVSTDFGHDGFLVEADKWGPAIQRELVNGVEETV